LLSLVCFRAQRRRSKINEKMKAMQSLIPELLPTYLAAVACWKIGNWGILGREKGSVNIADSVRSARWTGDLD
jgi:hypothetical protein